VNFLQAQKVLRAFKGGEELPLLLALSGLAEPLLPFIRAEAAKAGRDAKIETLPFNTLQQFLQGGTAPAGRVLLLLMPWDLVAALDWRTGVVADPLPLAEAFSEAITVLAGLDQHPDWQVAYLPASVPPLFSRPQENQQLSLWLAAKVAGAGIDFLDAGHFSLTSYLETGCPLEGQALGEVAERLLVHALHPTSETAKVLVTDFDGVLWHGLVGDDGVANLLCGAHDRGYPHFLYQTLLARLKKEGALLAGVSRNQPGVAQTGLGAVSMVLQEEDFVSILSSFHAKSSQIQLLAQELNLGLDTFVFVDDNPVELAEVSAQLPQVTCLQFPTAMDDLPGFLARLGALFAKDKVTAEDQSRTEMYRTRLAGLAPSEAKGADLEQFLQGLEMSLSIHDRTTEDQARALQLINKTNQFNLNGLRLTEAELQALLASGGHLFTASLTDRTGSHGEILSCLVTAEGEVQRLVMSCRVFQRRVEAAFLNWLVERLGALTLVFQETDRNLPFYQFLESLALTPDGNGRVQVEPSALPPACLAAQKLFRLETP
jgi:FkbH-like protein